jgi:hypothetical protein
VLYRLCKAGLKLNLEKFNFAHTEIKILSYLVDNQGIHIDQDKVKAIDNLKLPNSIKDTKSILGAVGFVYKFIPNCSTIYDPINYTLKRGFKFNWRQVQ